MEEEVGDLLRPANSQRFLLSPKSGYILSAMESPDFTDPTRGEQSGRKDKQAGRGRRDVTHWPTWLYPSLQAAGTSDTRPARASSAVSIEGSDFLRNWAPSAEIWSWLPGVFSQLGSLIKRKDLRFPPPTLRRVPASQGMEPQNPDPL